MVKYYYDDWLINLVQIDNIVWVRFNLPFIMRVKVAET